MLVVKWKTAQGFRHRDNCEDKETIIDHLLVPFDTVYLGEDDRLLQGNEIVKSSDVHAIK